jgi:hypothetical protein
MGRKKDRPQCGARCRDGHLCEARAVEGGTRCRIHGGAVQKRRIARENIERRAVLAQIEAYLTLSRRQRRWGTLQRPGPS